MNILTKFLLLFHVACVSRNWPRRLLGLPNICAEAPEGEAWVGMANRFTVLVGDWIQIFPYGDVDKAGPVDMKSGQKLNTTVVQRFNRESAERIVGSFNSAATRAGSRWTGRPWYIGHPDVPGLETKYPDKAAYGWIMAVEARHDGLYGRVNFSTEGAAMLANAKFKFHSPFVLGPKIATENGRDVYLPIWLESVGFTNDPNIPNTVLLVNCREAVARQIFTDMEAFYGLANYGTSAAARKAGSGSKNAKAEKARGVRASKSHGMSLADFYATNNQPGKTK